MSWPVKLLAASRSDRLFAEAVSLRAACVNNFEGKLTDGPGAPI